VLAVFSWRSALSRRRRPAHDRRLRPAVHPNGASRRPPGGTTPDHARPAGRPPRTTRAARPDPPALVRLRGSRNP